MSALSYKKLALDWVPDSQDKRRFYLITAIVLAVMLTLAVLVSLVDVPPKERRARQPVPERVAKFITKKKAIEVPKSKPKATPSPPKPILKPKPKVARENKSEIEKKKPLTAVEKKARDKAQNSGLLALGSELADLMDTTDVSAMVGAKVSKISENAKVSAGLSSDLFTQNATQGSGGVASSDYLAGVGSATQLSARHIALVKQSLLKSGQIEQRSGKSSEDRERSGAVRSEEEVTVVFDQNKSGLYSIYNRERRKNPGLKGKIVLEITIAPDGSVTKVRIASSELNNAALEQRLVMRVKQFQFGEKPVEAVTVTFPIEFLPS